MYKIIIIMSSVFLYLFIVVDYLLLFSIFNIFKNLSSTSYNTNNDDNNDDYNDVDNDGNYANEM